MQQAAAAAAATGDHGGNMSSEQMMKDKMFVKQHIRQAVLQRVGSKSHMENVDEETEARLAQVRGWNSFLGGRWWGGGGKKNQTDFNHEFTNVERWGGGDSCWKGVEVV